MAKVRLRTLHDPTYDGAPIVIRDRFVLKYGAYVNENEGYALLVLEENASIPAPRLHAMYRESMKLWRYHE